MDHLQNILENAFEQFHGAEECRLHPIFKQYSQ